MTINPFAELIQDRSRARKSFDQNADLCFLATTDPEDRAQIRTLVLRDIGDRYLTVFMNRSSPKWSQLQSNSQYQVLLYYPTIERQYRLSGTLSQLNPALVADSWQLRPDGSKYLDYYYNQVRAQSTSVTSRDELRNSLDALKQTLAEPDQLAAPNGACGLNLDINRIDRLDLSDPNRLHDRRLFLYAEGHWAEQILVP